MRRFLIVAYGLPIQGFEKNQNLVNLGFYFLRILIFVVLERSDQALLKAVYLTTFEAKKKWTLPVLAEAEYVGNCRFLILL